MNRTELWNMRCDLDPLKLHTYCGALSDHVQSFQTHLKQNNRQQPDFFMNASFVSPTSASPRPPVTAFTGNQSCLTKSRRGGRVKWQGTNVTLKIHDDFLECLLSVQYRVLLSLQICKLPWTQVKPDCNLSFKTPACSAMSQWNYKMVQYMVPQKNNSTVV